MTALELHFLGDFEVLKDGKPLPLPPSKKTRALLAYLSLNPRQFRREHLCELLWEIPDDPRGSLRWSLSKLRRLVDDDDQSRIIADRTNVGVDTIPWQLPRGIGISEFSRFPCMVRGRTRAVTA
jgi:DNA-binding SARP family transcriptional activator